MKVTVKEQPKERNYPYIGISNGIIVLFSGVDRGTAMNKQGAYSTGQYYDTWDESNFKLFEGVVELSND